MGGLSNRLRSSGNPFEDAPESYEAMSDALLRFPRQIYLVCIGPLTNAAEIAGCVALVERGGCSFVAKAARAQAAGAVAVIIVNYADTADDDEPSSGADPDAVKRSAAELIGSARRYPHGRPGTSWQPRPGVLPERRQARQGKHVREDLAYPRAAGPAAYTSGPGSPRRFSAE